MNQKLSDALDLLRMLEVVFEQQQLVESTEGASVGSSGKGKPGAFPWAGVRLTLKQSRARLNRIPLREEKAVLRWIPVHSKRLTRSKIHPVEALLTKKIIRKIVRLPLPRGKKQRPPRSRLIDPTGGRLIEFN